MLIVETLDIDPLMVVRLSLLNSLLVVVFQWAIGKRAVTAL
jgi:hypothetical protein